MWNEKSQLYLEVNSLFRKMLKTHCNIFFITFLLLCLSSLPACSEAEKGEEAAADKEAPAKVDAAQKEKILDELKKTFICPSANMPLAEALEEGEDCPAGTQLLEIVGTLLDAGWTEEKAKSTANFFNQGFDLFFFVVDRPSLGSKDAPVTMVEFTDMQCPFCGRYFNNTFSTLKKEYIDTGKLRYYQLNLPLQNHPQAFKAAEALYCANEEGKYWDMREVEFSNQRALAVEELKKYAKEIGLKEKPFAACLDSGRYAQKVQEDMKLASQAGVRGTPGFVVSKSRLGGKIRGLSFPELFRGDTRPIISGAQPTDNFKAAIEKALLKAKAK